MGDGLLTIGAFSRASMLSVKALRAYHEAGILVPARVDALTGYRSYHVGQLTDAVILRRLRMLDLPLGHVAEVLQAHDPEVTRRVLATHEARMRGRLTDVRRIVAELAEGVDAPAGHTPVHIRREPAAHTLAVRGQVAEADFAEFLDGAFAELTALANRLGVPPCAPAGALYPPEITGDDTQDVEAYLPLGRPVSLPAGRGRVRLGELPAARVAVLVHPGGYDDIAESYRRLGAWVALNAEPADAPVRESYLVSYGDVDDPARFRTEIQWPITPEEHP